MLRKDKFTPSPAFKEYMYGELIVAITTVGVRLVDDKNYNTCFGPFTMPLY